MKTTEQAVSSTYRDPYAWGGPTYPSYAGSLHADPGAAGAPPAGSSAVPAGSPPAGSNAGSPPAGSAPAGSPPAGPSNEDNIRNLRTNYETIKKDHDRYASLGKYEELESAHKVTQGLRTEAMTLGKQLGYSEQEIAEAFASNPRKLLSFLDRKAAETGGRRPNAGDPKQELARMVDEKTKPFTDFVNRQQTERAMSKFEGEFDRIHKEAFPQGVPEEVEGLIYEGVSMLFMSNPTALEALKKEGKTGEIAQIYTKVKDTIQAAFVKWQAAQSGGAPPPPGGDQNKGGKRPTLDEMIDNPALINKRYA